MGKYSDKNLSPKFRRSYNQRRSRTVIYANFLKLFSQLIVMIISSLAAMIFVSVCDCIYLHRLCGMWVWVGMIMKWNFHWKNPEKCQSRLTKLERSIGFYADTWHAS